MASRQHALNRMQQAAAEAGHALGRGWAAIGKQQRRALGQTAAEQAFGAERRIGGVGNDRRLPGRGRHVLRRVAEEGGAHPPPPAPASAADRAAVFERPACGALAMTPMAQDGVILSSR